MSMAFTFTAPEGTTLGATDVESSGVNFTFSTASSGVQGATGAKGDKGDKGEQGVQGPAGTTDYNDLQNKPAIPTKTSDLTNDSNYITDAGYVHTDNNFDDIEKQAIANNATAIATLDTNKVDKVSGKQLSTEDYTTAEKDKLSDIDLTKYPTIMEQDAALSFKADKTEIVDLAGATATADGSKGYAPKPSAGDQDKFLKGDGTWADLNETRVIKGVSFDAATAAGTRILNAVSDSFTPATETSVGVDTMASFAPYATYETLEKLNTSTGKLEVVAYEGDMLFDQYLTAAKQGSNCSDICDAVMVNFPMGYISRHQDSTGKEVWGVADKQVSGVIPSPMHFRNGAMRRVKIGKYPTGILNGKAVSLPNVNTYNAQNLNTYSTRFLADLGCYAMDLACLNYLQILGSIKYANRDWQTAVGKGITSFTYDYLPNTITVSETGVSRIVVSNANAAKFAVGQNIQIFSTSISTFETTITEIGTYDTDNSYIAVSYATTFDTTASTSGFRRMPMKTGGSINILNRDGYAGTNDGYHSASFLGLEDFIGNIATQINGFAIASDGTLYYNTDPAKCLVQPTSVDNALSLGYVATGVKGCLTAGWQKSSVYNSGSDQWVIYPATIGGTSANPIGDYFDFYPRDYLRGLVSLGAFRRGSLAGGFFGYSGYSVVYGDISWGARLVGFSDL